LNYHGSPRTIATVSPAQRTVTESQRSSN